MPELTTTWYGVARRGLYVEAVSVGRATDNSIYIQRASLFGRAPTLIRTLKHTEYFSYYPTFAEAKTVLTDRLSLRLSEALDEVNEIRSAIYRTANLTADGVQND